METTVRTCDDCVKISLLSPWYLPLQERVLKHSWVRVWREHNVGRRSVCLCCLLVKLEKPRLLGWQTTYSGGFTAFAHTPVCQPISAHSAHRWGRGSDPWEVCEVCDAEAMFIAYEGDVQRLWMRKGSTMKWLNEYIPCSRRM